MAETKKKTSKKQSNPLVGSIAKPTPNDSAPKLDIDVKGTLIDNIIDAGMSSRLDTSALDRFTTISNARDQVYQLIDTMCNDASIAAIVRTFSEDACEPADNGHIVWCESEDQNVSKFVNYLLDTMNVDKYVYKWTYCLVKYGDVYLRLYRESDYVDKLFDRKKVDAVNNARQLTEGLDESVNISLHSISDPYSHYVEMVADPGTMYELTRYGQTFGYIEVPNDPNPIDQSTYVGGTTGLMSASTTNFNYRYKSNDVNVYQADDFVHGSLEDNVSRFPETVDLFYGTEDINDKNAKSQTYYVKRGKSMLYDAYKIWREKALLEAAALLSRLTRSGIIRKVAVEVGDAPKEQIMDVLRRVKSMFEQKTAMNTDQSFSEYTSPNPVENFIYYPTHGGVGAITVDSVGGDYDPKSLVDLDWWNRKLYGSFGIPPQFFGWTADSTGFNGGTSLSIISSIYAKSVKRIQNTIIQMLTDLVSLMLLNRGCKTYLNRFTLKMRAPVTQDELDYRSNLTDRIQSINSLNSLFTDVEDKSRRLEILKSLIATLNLGDSILTVLQEEINATKKEEEEAERENAQGEAESAPETAGGADFEFPQIPESAEPEKGETLTEDAFGLDEAEDLPTPEEAASDVDFTKNE